MATATLKESVGGGLMAVGVGVAAGCPMLLLYQTGIWVSDGTWPEMPLGIVCERLGIHLAGMDWQGLDEILVLMLQQPTAAVLFVSGMALHYLGAKVAGHM